LACYIGVDAHVKECALAIKEDVRLVERLRIESSREAFLKVHKRYPTATWILEASLVHEWIYDTLVGNGASVFAAHPVNILRAEQTKNDDFDAQFLVDAHLLGRLRSVYVPPKPIRALRQLGRDRAALVQDRTRMKNRIRTRLHRMGLKPTKDETGSAWTKKHKTYLRHLGDETITRHLRMIDALDNEVDELNEKIEKAVQNDENMRRLSSIPGVGNTTSIVIYSEIGDIHRFESPAKLNSYFGLVPHVQQSGETTTRGHITRRGNSLTRWVLVQAAWQHVRCAKKSSLTRRFRKQEKRTGNKRAIVGLARGLTTVCYHILKEERDFRMNG
jgi:transposase